MFSNRTAESAQPLNKEQERNTPRGRCDITSSSIFCTQQNMTCFDIVTVSLNHNNARQEVCPNHTAAPKKWKTRAVTV